MSKRKIKIKNDYRAKFLSNFARHYTGNKNHAWKGNKVKYGALHMWVRRWKGKANKCENKDCIYPRKRHRGSLMLKPSIYHWANKSGKYLRNLSDYISLCSSCHQKRDRKIKYKHPILQREINYKRIKKYNKV